MKRFKVTAKQTMNMLMASADDMKNAVIKEISAENEWEARKIIVNELNALTPGKFLYTEASCEVEEVKEAEEEINIKDVFIKLSEKIENAFEEAKAVYGSEKKEIVSFLNSYDNFYNTISMAPESQKQMVKKKLDKVFSFALESLLKSAFYSDSNIEIQNNKVAVIIGKGSFRVKDILKSNGFGFNRKIFGEFSRTYTNWSKEYDSIKDAYNDLLNLNLIK